MSISVSIDALPADLIKDIQRDLFINTVRHAYENSLFYKNRFDDNCVHPSDIKNLEDIKKLPFTGKEDIQKDNWSLLAVPRENISEIVSTTGTTGDPVFIALTANDLERLACNEEKSFGYAGAVKGDVFNIAVTCDNLFIAGIAYYRGLTKLGASVTRLGPQNILRHLDIMKELKPTGIVAVPSFMVQLARRAEEYGVPVKELGIRKIVLIGDSIRDADLTTNALGNLIETAFGKICYSTYGITEAQLSFCECRVHHGLHSHPDLVLTEIVDEDGRLLPDGDEGELVLTPLQLEGMPLIRYRTGDVTFKLSTPCACGRNSARIGPIIGRKQQKLKVKGVTLYPRNIENAILGLQDVINYQIEAYTGDDRTDRIILRIGSHVVNGGFKSVLKDAVLAKARVTPEIEIELPEEIERRLFENGGRKAVTFKDRRQKAI
ncbi:MAG: phenylacetate--CoA ligase family protein [Nitrospiraceae bacterium]|nr:MAG: phenylacetate--CoA ligase family protein [Nitrospiraceae bacterium]